MGDNTYINEAELKARYVARAEKYAKLVHIEANTMVYMARQMYLPALSGYSSELAASVATKRGLGLEPKAEADLVAKLTAGIDEIAEKLEDLETRNDEAYSIEDPKERDDNYKDSVLPAMDALRAAVDAMEPLCSEDWWPVPTYNSILFWV